MIVAACQMDVRWEDRAANHAKARALLESAKLPRGSLAALPEMFATGYSMNLEATCDPAGVEQTEKFLAELARDLGVFILAGVTSRDESGLGRNDAAAFDPQGRSLGRYCKLHPFSFAGEDKYYVAGQCSRTFACGEFQVAPFVCFDLRFPEIFRQAAFGGAQLLAVLANWPASRESHWLALLRARAIENQAYVLAVNRVGNDPHVSYNGRSQIIDPHGQILADAGGSSDDGEKVISAMAEVGPLEEYRKSFPALREAALGRGFKASL